MNIDMAHYNTGQHYETHTDRITDHHNVYTTESTATNHGADYGRQIDQPLLAYDYD